MMNLKNPFRKPDYELPVEESIEIDGSIWVKEPFLRLDAARNCTNSEKRVANILVSCRTRFGNAVSTLEHTKIFVEESTRF